MLVLKSYLIEAARLSDIDLKLKLCKALRIFLNILKIKLNGQCVFLKLLFGLNVAEINSRVFSQRVL